MNRNSLLAIAASLAIGLLASVACAPGAARQSSDPRSLAQEGVANNADWTPHIEEINSVEMALVPAGCFMMGSEDGDSDERPVRRVCFEQPFWIDVYEVTNEQFNTFGGQAADSSYSTHSMLPRENLRWAEADAFCKLRGARLPTEAEWEYAARGPDALAYPWGDSFVEDNVVYHGAPVGSKPDGVSWVGAHDMSGSVWEYVGDWYDAAYYATLADDAVNPQGPPSGERVVLRGGSANPVFEGDFRAASRVDWDLAMTANLVGFRCALAYEPDS